MGKLKFKENIHQIKKTKLISYLLLIPALIAYRHSSAKLYFSTCAIVNSK